MGERARAGQAVGGVLLAALALAGCKGSVEVKSDPPRLSEKKVEQEVTRSLTEEVGTAPDDIDCPGDLEGVKGTTMTCVLTAGEDHLDVAVEVTSVEGSHIRFSAQVAEMDDPS